MNLKYITLCKLIFILIFSSAIFAQQTEINSNEVGKQQPDALKNTIKDTDVFGDKITQLNKPRDLAQEQKLPFAIDAGEVILDNKKHFSNYSLGIVIRHGSLKISAEEAKVYHPNKKPTKIIVVGRPAKFRKYDYSNQYWISGQASKITYNLNSKLILLEGDASFKHGLKSEIYGGFFKYDLQKRNFEVKSQPISNPENKKDSKKVRILLDAQ